MSTFSSKFKSYTQNTSQNLESYREDVPNEPQHFKRNEQDQWSSYGTQRNLNSTRNLNYQKEDQKNSTFYKDQKTDFDTTRALKEYKTSSYHKDPKNDYESSRDLTNKTSTFYKDQKNDYDTTGGRDFKDYKKGASSSQNYYDTSEKKENYYREKSEAYNKPQYDQRSYNNSENKENRMDKWKNDWSSYNNNDQSNYYNNSKAENGYEEDKEDGNVEDEDDDQPQNSEEAARKEWKLPKIDWETEMESINKEHALTNPNKDISVEKIQNFDSDDRIPPYMKDTLRYLYGKDYRPTSIQANVWPKLLKGSDVVAISETGSGKTDCILVPGIIHIINQLKNDYSQPHMMVVLVPTRELAQQFKFMCDKLIKALNAHLFLEDESVRVGCVYGGEKMGLQMAELAKMPQILIGTCGRLCDQVSKGVINLKLCSYFCVDEADTLLTNFNQSVYLLKSFMRRDVQLCFISATWTPECKTHSKDFFLERPQMLFLTEEDHEDTRDFETTLRLVNQQIKQRFVRVYEAEIYNKLLYTIQDIKNHCSSADDFKMLIFVNTIRDADHLVSLLREDGLNAMCLHGKKDQMERNWVYGQFKNGTRINTLVATDVMGRGMDFTNVRWVINYQFPAYIEEYVHRIGRCVREEGKRKNQVNCESFTFFTESSLSKAKDLMVLLYQFDIKVPEWILFPNAPQLFDYSEDLVTVKDVGLTVDMNIYDQEKVLDEYIKRKKGIDGSDGNDGDEISHDSKEENFAY